jgi:non-heme chloroperoxidase
MKEKPTLVRLSSLAAAGRGRRGGVLAFFALAACSGAGVLALPTPSPDAGVPIDRGSAGDSLSTVTADGIEIHYLERGHGPAVLLVHGSLVDYRDWREQVGPLSEGFRVIAPSRRYNYPNRNRSLEPAYSVKHDAADLASLIEQLGAAPVVAIGSSYGAYAALQLALTRRDLVRGLVLAEPPILSLLPGGEAGFMERVWSPLRDAFLTGDDAALDFTSRWYLGVGIDGAPPEVADLWRANLAEWRALALSSDPFPAIDPEALRRLTVPTLLVSGSESRGINPPIDAELDRLLPGSRRVVIPGGGHEMYLENPSAFNTAVREFIAEVGAGSPPIPIGAASGDSLMMVTVDGVEIHYRDWGSGEPIVFVHGGLVDYREWGAVARALSDRYRVITYSRRYNHPNRNRLLDSDHSAAVEAEDLAALIRRLDLGPVHIGGTSYGAYTGLLTALVNPELVRSLTVVEPPLLPWAPDLPGGQAMYDEFMAMWNASGDAAARGDSIAALRAAIDWFVAPGALDAVPAEFVAMLMGNIEEWRALTTSNDPFPDLSREDVASIQVPILMISGGRSYPVFRLIDDELERHLRRGRRHIVPQGTHDVCSSEWETCARLIRDFLEG